MLAECAHAIAEAVATLVERGNTTVTVYLDPDGIAFLVGEPLADVIALDTRMITRDNLMQEV